MSSCKSNEASSSPEYRRTRNLQKQRLLALVAASLPARVSLLPSDFFEASVKRSRIYNLMDWAVITEYKLGHLSFYAHNKRAEKKSVDSLFCIQKGREGKFQHTVINARSAGMLSVE